MLFFLFIRYDHGAYRASFRFGLAHYARLSQCTDEPFHDLKSKFFSRDFPSPEKHHYFDLIPVFQERLGFLSPRFKVMHAYEWSQADLFYPDVFLTFFTFPFFFGFLVLELFVIDKFRYRRFGIGRNFDNIKAQFLSLLQGFNFGYNAYLLAILGQKPHSWTGNLVIETIVFTGCAQSLLSIEG